MKVCAIALNTFRELIRNKVLYSMLFFAVLLVAVSAFFGEVSIGDQEKVIKDFGLFALSFFGAMISILSGVSLLRKELSQKTIHHILSKPVSRWQFLVGKYIGLNMTVGVMLSIMSFGLVVFVSFFESKVDYLLFQAALFILLETAIVCSLVIFFSSMVITNTLTGLFTLGTYLAGKSIRYLTYFLEESDSSSEAIRWTISVLYWIVPDLSLFNVNDLVVSAEKVSLAQLGYALTYSLSYSAAALALAILIFRRRELT